MFANNKYAKVWKIYPKEKADQKYTAIQISTSRKQKDGSYVNDFSGYVRLIGDAQEKAKELESGDKIKMLSVGVCNSYNRELKKKSQDYFYCYDFEFDNDNKKSASDENFVALPEDEKLPFDD